MIFAASNGYVDAYPESDVKNYEAEMVDFLKNKHSGILKTISEKKAIADDTKKLLVAALEEFKSIFQPSNK